MFDTYHYSRLKNTRKYLFPLHTIAFVLLVINSYGIILYLWLLVLTMFIRAYDIKIVLTDISESPLLSYDAQYMQIFVT